MYKAQLEDFSDVMALRRRLGFARTFPYVQPEFDQFQLDLRLHDERVCMTALLALSARENAGNIRHPVHLGQLSPEHQAHHASLSSLSWALSALCES